MTTVHRTKNYQTKKSEDGGFTLIEMIAVVLIIGILSAIAAPGWLGFVNRQRLNKASDGLISAVRQAQTEAKNKKLSYSVSFQVNTNNIPEYIIYQGTTAPTTGWNTLGDTLDLKARQVFIYTNLKSLTDYNTTTASDIVTTAKGKGTITFDYLGVLANKTSNTVANTPIKVMVATPQATGDAAGNLKRCVIIEGLIGGMRTAKDADCMQLN